MATVSPKIEPWGRYIIAWAQSDNIQESLDLLSSGAVNGIGISPYSGYSGRDISFLSDVEGLLGVVIPFAEKYDLSVLGELPGLQFLTVAGYQQPLDCRGFDQLDDLRVEWTPRLILPESSSAIRSLYLRGYNPNSKTLNSLPVYEAIEDIEINQGNLLSIEGIDRMPSLVMAKFYGLQDLQSVAACAGTKIKRLHIESSNKLVDVEQLGGCRELISLRLINCANLKSLQFITKFKCLEDFRFVGTFVEDGNMAPLLSMKSVGFVRVKGYSHTPSEIRQVIDGVSH